jgi:hypothetical protein
MCALSAVKSPPSYGSGGVVFHWSVLTSLAIHLFEHAVHAIQDSSGQLRICEDDAHLMGNLRIRLRIPMIPYICSGVFVHA